MCVCVCLCVCVSDESLIPDQQWPSLVRLCITYSATLWEIGSLLMDGEKKNKTFLSSQFVHLKKNRPFTQWVIHQTDFVLKLMTASLFNDSYVSGLSCCCSDTDINQLLGHRCVQTGSEVKFLHGFNHWAVVVYVRLPQSSVVTVQTLAAAPAGPSSLLPLWSSWGKSRFMELKHHQLAQRQQAKFFLFTEPVKTVLPFTVMLILSSISSF